MEATTAAKMERRLPRCEPVLAEVEVRPVSATDMGTGFPGLGVLSDDGVSATRTAGATHCEAALTAAESAGSAHGRDHTTREGAMSHRAQSIVTTSRGCDADDVGTPFQFPVAARWGRISLLHIQDGDGSRAFQNQGRRRPIASPPRRLAASALCGRRTPVVGSALLLILGPTYGIFANIALYLPMTLLLLRTPQTGHLRSGYVMDHRPGLRETFSVLGTVAHDRVLLGMIMLAGLGALAIGGSLQVSMPDFATGNLSMGSEGLGYGTLLFAGGVGGVLGGFLLEATGRIRPTVGVVVVSSLLFGATTYMVATTHSYPIALVALVIGGFANLASNTVSQAIVQLRAPVRERGRVVGVYSMFGSGLRTGNGLTLALLGALWGIPAAVATGGAFLVISTLILAFVIRRPSSTTGG